MDLIPLQRSCVVALTKKLGSPPKLGPVLGSLASTPCPGTSRSTTSPWRSTAPRCCRTLSWNSAVGADMASSEKTDPERVHCCLSWGTERFPSRYEWPRHRSDKAKCKKKVYTLFRRITLTSTTCHAKFQPRPRQPSRPSWRLTRRG